MAMGAISIALVYSPWGRQSGTHANSAITFAYSGLARARSKYPMHSSTHFHSLPAVQAVAFSIQSCSDVSSAYRRFDTWSLKNMNRTRQIHLKDNPHYLSEDHIQFTPILHAIRDAAPNSKPTRVLNRSRSTFGAT
jgi:hypothetical protein